ncbi:TFIIB-type zinc ribbon-containing protein [Candidatus Saccharibacteria bacterium]|nr:TFIIB-type zinc ribbon-containing protein [Candidatus Saccharibacteria bacterium]
MAEKGRPKNGAKRCPNCGATDVVLDVIEGKLKCNFCRTVFDNVSANELGGVEHLEGVKVGSGAEDIVPDESVILTLKCSSCGAEVVINTDETVNARCHWCRHNLSVNEKMPNGAVPDLVLPFEMAKTAAERKIREFVEKRKFFAHPVFKKEFTTENILGVYLPYMVVDVNAHVRLLGEGEILKMAYNGGYKNNTRYYDAYVFEIGREFDLLVDDLTIEASAERLAQNVTVNTNNIINAIMPFDTENCVAWDARYLRGFASERRDTNVEALRSQLKLQVEDVARHEARETTSQYDRGVRWIKEDLQIKGEGWKAAYLPIWLYSYMEKTGNKKLLHYVAVNARTGETMGSVPINKKRLLGAAMMVELIGIFLGWKWFSYWIGIDVDDSNPAFLGALGLTPGFIYYWVMTNRYRNLSARHKHEAETKTTVKNMKAKDVQWEVRKRLRNRRIEGENGNLVRGSLVQGAHSMMGEKMADILGVGKMFGDESGNMEKK